MRVYSLAILMLLLSSTLLLMDTNNVRAQTAEITTARTDIARAFQSIQTAEQQGASHAQLESLILQLNQALQFEENATSYAAQNDTTSADSYALQSITISNNVSLEAQNLGSQAQAARQIQTLIYYLVAIASAIILALAILEGNRVKKLMQRRRSMRSKIELKESKNA